MTNLMRLEERTAVVTGAASGIGRAIAVALARRHCHLALVHIAGVGLAQTIKLIKTLCGSSEHSPP